MFGTISNFVNQNSMKNYSNKRNGDNSKENNNKSDLKFKSSPTADTVSFKANLAEYANDILKTNACSLAEMLGKEKDLAIETVKAYEKLDSRGNSTLKAIVKLASGDIGEFSVPSGADLQGNAKLVNIEMPKRELFRLLIM